MSSREGNGYYAIASVDESGTRASRKRKLSSLPLALHLPRHDVVLLRDAMLLLVMLGVRPLSVPLLFGLPFLLFDQI